MIVEIKKEGDFYVVYYFTKEIIRKKSMIRATKALAAYIKGRS